MTAEGATSLLCALAILGPDWKFDALAGMGRSHLGHKQAHSLQKLSEFIDFTSTRIDE